MACYLDHLFPEYDVDCEYNRNSKIDDRNHSKSITIYNENQELKKEKDQTYPDIIIHKRLTNENNLLIIELKKNNSKTTKNDLEKLIAFTESGPSNEYHFFLGAYININTKTASYNVQWYENGEKKD